MADIKNTDGYVSQGYHYHQDNLGALTVAVLHYDHIDQHNLKIIIYRQVKGIDGYGEKVFTGTLADLIARLEDKP